MSKAFLSHMVKAELYRALWIQCAATMTGVGVLLTYLK